MRTTVRLDDDLFREVKLYATEQGQTFTEVLSRALRELMARSEVTPERPRLVLPTYRGRGLQAGVDLDNTAALLDLMAEADDSNEEIP